VYVAYNYGNYMGSDRMWEIHSWIQWMAQKMGYETPIRPAPLSLSSEDV